MNINIGDNVLVTTNDWFFAPDGGQYKAVWGTVLSVENDQETLGIKTNARSSNWYLNIGNMVVAGCQIHYAIKSDVVNFVDYSCEEFKDGVVRRDKLSSRIYNANKTYQEG